MRLLITFLGFFALSAVSFAQVNTSRPLNFKPTSYFPLLDDPLVIRKADVNMDGQPDILSVNDGNIGVLINNNGDFSQIATYPPSIFSSFNIRNGDYNNDQAPDLFVPYNNDTVAILLNNGEGSFSVGNKIATGPATQDVAILDLNKDGRDDMAAFSMFPPVVKVFLNSANGFGSPTAYPVQTGISIAAGDFNNDGSFDLITTASDAHAVNVMINNGDGTFKSPVGYTTSKQYPGLLLVTNLNNDEYDDLIVGYSQADPDVYYSNAGTLTLQPTNLVSGTGGSHNIATGDFNGDERTDVATVDWDHDLLRVFIADGAGSFNTPTEYQAPIQPRGLITGDFNGDGSEDIATASFDRVSLFLNDGQGVFTTGESFGPGHPAKSTTGDFNGDGWVDVAALNSHSMSVSVSLNDQTGRFLPLVNFPTGKEPNDIKSADFNDDDILDLVTANFKDSNVGILVGNGDGTFENVVTYPVGTNPYSVAIGNVNDDQRPDLVVANLVDNHISVLLNTGTSFNSAADISFGNATQVAIGDLNEDSFDDVVAVRQYYPSQTGVWYFLNNGDDTFGPANLLANSSQVYEVKVLDINADDRNDIMAMTDGGHVALYFNDGDAVFAPLKSYRIGTNDRNLSVGDFDGDGKKDIALCHPFVISVLLSNDTGGYDEVRHFNNMNPFAMSMNPADIDRDGRDDLVVTSWPGNYLTTLRSLSTLKITARNAIRKYGYPNPIFESDIEGLLDGDLVEVTYTTDGNILRSVGDYEITPKADKVTEGNYAVVVFDGKLTITKAPLKVTARDTSRNVGQPNPVFKYTIEGVKNEDFVSVFLTTTATAQSPPGTYPIKTEVFFAEDNYEAELINGVLTVKLVVGLDDAGPGALVPYPNPADGVFYLDFDNSTALDYEVINVTGQLVTRGHLTSGQNRIEVPAGEMYVLKFGNGVTRKIWVK